MARIIYGVSIQRPFLTQVSCLPDGSGGHIRIDRTAARPVGQPLTATNAHDPATSERGGPSPYRAVEQWLLLLLLLLLLLYYLHFTSRTQYTLIPSLYLGGKFGSTCQTFTKVGVTFM
jgi:hypothetical protein